MSHIGAQFHHGTEPRLNHAKTREDKFAFILWSPQIAEWLRTSLHRSSVEVIFRRWKVWAKKVARKFYFIGLDVDPEIGQIVLPAPDSLQDDVEVGVPGRITSIKEGEYREVFVQWFSDNGLRGPYIVPHKQNMWENAQLNFVTSSTPESLSGPLILASHQAIQEALDVHHLPELAKHYVTTFPEKKSLLSANYQLVLPKVSNDSHRFRAFPLTRSHIVLGSELGPAVPGRSAHARCSAGPSAARC